MLGPQISGKVPEGTWNVEQFGDSSVDIPDYVHRLLVPEKCSLWLVLRKGTSRTPLHSHLLVEVNVTVTPYRGSEHEREGESPTGGVGGQRKVSSQ